MTFKVYEGPYLNFKIVISGTGSTYDYGDYSTGAPIYIDSNLYDKIELIFEKGITRIGNNFCDRTYKPDSVSLPEGLKSIGKDAFEGCDFTSIKIPNTVKSIGAGAFYRCEKLKSVTIPDGVTAIGDHTFSECTSLKTVSLGKGVKTIGESAFGDCSSLTSITIPNNVTKIGPYAFDCCDRLKTVRLGSSLTKLDTVFCDCPKLTKVIFPKKSKIKSIGEWCFACCDNLKNITLPKSVKEIKAYTFHQCRKLRVITLLSKKPPKIKSRSVFSECNTKKMTIKCPKMSKATKKKFLKQLKKIGFKGKVK